MPNVTAQDRRLGLARIEVNGKRYTKYDPTIAIDIVERVAEGELLQDICAKDAAVPTVAKTTFMRWVSTVPELQKAFAAAKQLSALSFEEKAISKAEATAKDPKSPQNVSAASLLVHQYQWSAARRNPTVYSDKGNTQIVVPVNISTTLDMGTGAGIVDVEVPDIYTLKFPAQQITEGEYEDVTPSTIEDDKESGRLNAIKAITAEMRGSVGQVVGTSHQPIFEATKDRSGPPHPTGPRKRVLVPGMYRKPRSHA